MWYFILFAVTLLIDQISKIIVDANNFDITVIEGFLNIDNEYNPGASFSFLAGVSWAQTFFYRANRSSSCCGRNFCACC